MKKLSIFGALFVSLGAASAWATNACVTTTLDQMLGSNFSCQIGDKIFSNFTYTDSSMNGAAAVPSSGVQVETVGPSGETVLGPNIGLQFNASWTALAGQSTDADISFSVTVVGGGGMLITDTGLAQTSGVTALNGDASVTEDACAPAIQNGFPCTPNFQAVITFDQGSGHQQISSDPPLLAPTGSIRVSKDINVVDNDPNIMRTMASISLVTDTFSQSAVPEPATMLLTGAALCGIALLRRRAA